MRKVLTIESLKQCLEALGAATTGQGNVYLTGGACALLYGWRDTTIDIDLKFDPEAPGIFEAISKLKNSLQLNIELASPDLFIPELPAWKERSIFICRVKEVEFYHYDFYSQAIAKIQRGFSLDLKDVSFMFEKGLVEKNRLLSLFLEIKPKFIRYPAIDVNVLERKIKEICR